MNTAIRFARLTVIMASALLFALLSGLCTATESANESKTKDTPSIRSGKIVSVYESKVFTFLEARDEAGKLFWIGAPRCQAKVGDDVQVLDAKHENSIESTNLNRKLNDFYGANVVRLNGRVVTHPATHGLPNSPNDEKPPEKAP